MDKIILNRVYATAISAAVTFLTGFGLRKIWTMATGGEPPNPEDPDVPVRQALIWFLASGVGVGLAQLLFQRSIAQRMKILAEGNPRV
ncbi:MAG: DUF4235 domain-containing protein [Propionibacteriaceae bacterium]|jgi:hypothetical protein|nr:DUF4235 domain-containing protein [Propionibacteriaceae bacterium]